MEHANELYKDWLGAFAAIGTPAIGRDTAARILAVTYVHGNNEALTMNRKYLQEIEHIQQMYHIHGAGTPDAEIIPLIQQYIKELEQYRELHSNDHTDDVVFRNHAPEWAHKLFAERFGIKLIN